MSSRWIKIFLVVTLCHALMLKFVWVGLAVPRQALHADFFYSGASSQQDFSESQRSWRGEGNVLLPRKISEFDEQQALKILIKP